MGRGASIGIECCRGVMQLLPRIEKPDPTCLHICGVSGYDRHTVCNPNRCNQAVDRRHSRSGFFGDCLNVSPYPGDFGIDRDNFLGELFKQFRFQPLMKVMFFSAFRKPRYDFLDFTNRDTA
jgi:hypothetical protein